MIGDGTMLRGPVLPGAKSLSHRLAQRSATGPEINNLGCGQRRDFGQRKLAGVDWTFRGPAAEPSAADFLRGSEEMADGLDELADRDRFRQIGLAPALADAFLVTLHGEGCH